MRIHFSILCLFFILINLHATKLVTVKVLDKDYLMIHFKDGDVTFTDDGKGPSAFTSDHITSNNTVVRYGVALDTFHAVNKINWKIKSADDSNYGSTGLSPVNCYRKSKLNGMAEMEWAGTDWDYQCTMEHFIFIKLPFSLVQGKSYTLEINPDIKTDVNTNSFTYDIFNSRSEAIHVNLVGYPATPGIKSADLYYWMGGGGARDYTDFQGKKVHIYNVDTKKSQEVGKVTFWNRGGEDVNRYNFTQSAVWNVDFTGFNTPGMFRLAVEGIGCSEDFKIGNNIYYEPFRVSILGFFYMRIGQDNLNMTPVPRRPLYIPGINPSNTSISITTMHPWHSEFKTFSHGDVWDRPTDWAKYSTGRKNMKATGGHSDALDWDRHLGHISIIWDMLLPFILTDGAISDDNLGIAESGNGSPDILDEAKNEVDFWLLVRDGKGYGTGLTNPDKNNVLYQACNTAMAAWASSANSAMLADCYRISGQKNLMSTYRDSAINAYNFASSLTDQMLDSKLNIGEGFIRGRDLKMMAAAYLYNLTGETKFEEVIKNESVVENNNSVVSHKTNYNQLYATAGYLKTNRAIHYNSLFENMKASIINEAKSIEVNYSKGRPSRRATDNNFGYFHTEQNVQRTMIAHAITADPNLKSLFEDALLLEADWGLGRNPLNIIQMTTATTNLQNKRSIENIYTSGRNDGTPGLHPGHTPYLNTDDWSKSMIMGSPSYMASKSYPAKDWPKAEQYFNTRYVWSHSEFTPQQTMRGKQALYGYLYGIKKK